MQLRTSWPMSFGRSIGEMRCQCAGLARATDLGTDHPRRGGATAIVQGLSRASLSVTVQGSGWWIFLSRPYVSWLRMMSDIPMSPHLPLPQKKRGFDPRTVTLECHRLDAGQRAMQLARSWARGFVIRA